MDTGGKFTSTVNMCCLMSVGMLHSSVVKPKFQLSSRYIKYIFAKPWNHTIKPWLKAAYRRYLAMKHDPVSQSLITSEGSERIPQIREVSAPFVFKPGDLVRVKSADEIAMTLNPFHECKGCAFLDSMYEYCGTIQRVNTRVERFLDERSFEVKSAKGLYFLDNLFCTGTTVFGRCDRRCYYFWRVEWLEIV